MARSKKALEEAAAKSFKSMVGTKSAEEEKRSVDLLETAARCIKPSNPSGGDLMVMEAAKNAWVEAYGFDLIDVEDILPNKENTYSIDDDSIKTLAAMILESKTTTPIEVQRIETDEQGRSYLLIDGERRLRAHKYLAGNVDAGYRMIPAHVRKEGELSDDEMRFVLHAENLGQRDMSPSERIRGFEVLQEWVAARKERGEFNGERTREVIARLTGAGSAQISRYLMLASKLAPEARGALDNGDITLTQALEIAKLDVEEQVARVSYKATLCEAGKKMFDDKAITTAQAIELAQMEPDEQEQTVALLEGKLIDEAKEALAAGVLDIEQAVELAKETERDQRASLKAARKTASSNGSPANRPKKTVNDELRAALNAMRRAEKAEGGEVDLGLLGQIKQLVRELDPDRG